MNKKLPFEEAFERQMNDLPSPNEDESWQKMKQLLDDNEKPVPFAFFKFYKMAGVLLLLLFIGGWLAIRKSKAINEQSAATTESKVSLNHTTLAPRLPNTANKTQTSEPTIPGASLEIVNNENNITAPSIALNKKPIPLKKTRLNAGSSNQISVVKTVLKRNRNYQHNLPAIRQTNINKYSPDRIQLTIVAKKDNLINTDESVTDPKKINSTRDTTTITQSNQQYELITQHKDTLLPKENVAQNVNVANEKTHVSKLNKFVLNAGIGVQQQIPVAGQQIFGYGYNGRNTLSDYIPSVYIRLEKEKKWFLQAEFIYGNPRLVKEFAYSRKTQADTSNTITTTATHLKKTFYSEIPVIFNYHVRRNWSVGVGGTYSWLHGAIAEKETNTRNPLTQVNSVQRQVMPIAGYTDSFLYKSHTNLLLQTNYHWRKLTAGLRFTKDVQPYIKYTLPDGTVTDQKNWALEFILRFNLFKSAQF